MEQQEQQGIVRMFIDKNTIPLLIMLDDTESIIHTKPFRKLKNTIITQLTTERQLDLFGEDYT
jgi:hypothetical protein